MHQARNLEAINPDLTPEIMAKISDIIKIHRDKPGSLIPVLEECQGVLGYLPVELQQYIGEELNIPGSTVYGVVTFYSFFSMVLFLLPPPRKLVILYLKYHKVCL